MGSLLEVIFEQFGTLLGVILASFHPKSVKIETWTGPGGSWGRPWEPFWLPRAPRTAKSGRMAKNGPNMGAHLRSIFDIFYDLLAPFGDFLPDFLQVTLLHVFFSVLLADP